MSEMLICTPDTKKRWQWDPSDQESVAKVKEEFDKLVDFNFAYKTTETGKEQIRSFDPFAESITITAPLVGG